MGKGTHMKFRYFYLFIIGIAVASPLTATFDFQYTEEDYPYEKASRDKLLQRTDVPKEQKKFMVDQVLYIASSLGKTAYVDEALRVQISPSLIGLAEAYVEAAPRTDKKDKVREVIEHWIFATYENPREIIKALREAVAENQQDDEHHLGRSSKTPSR